nr:MAG TPA_asm: hypothetical protein [Caudoviricetes sp.]
MTIFICIITKIFPVRLQVFPLRILMEPLPSLSILILVTMHRRMPIGMNLSTLHMTMGRSQMYQTLN